MTHTERTLDATAVPHELETRVRVSSKTEAAEGVLALRLVAAEAGTLPGWEPGAHVDLVIEGVATRQYSLCGDPADRTAYRLGVLLDPAGRGSSRYVHESLRVGDVVTLRGPRNNFALAGAPGYLFIAGGIGITPILPMIRAADAAGASWRLVYGGRHRASMAFVEELVGYGDRVQVAPQDEVGLLDLAGLLGAPADDTLVYCCGPEPLLAAVEAACTAWPARSLHVERFNPKPQGEPVSHDSFEVVLHRSGRSLMVGPDTSILAAVREAGVSVLSSCEEGTCGTCETALLEGEADHRDSLLDDDERAENTCMMICVSRALSARLVLDL
ncbi:PDR/VanB family oxidoreductase [Nocardioides sp.]|uniref:PDR/VanB family oxidoreductase n=1 Tax=Nocardioides sp. TaxID=35761 RepID=UPI003D0CB165